MTNLMQEYADARAAVIAMNLHNRPIELLEDLEQTRIRLQASEDILVMRQNLIKELNEKRGELFETQ